MPASIAKEAVSAGVPARELASFCIRAGEMHQEAHQTEEGGGTRRTVGFHTLNAQSRIQSAHNFNEETRG